MQVHSKRLAISLFACAGGLVWIALSGVGDGAHPSALAGGSDTVIAEQGATPRIIHATVPPAPEARVERDQASEQKTRDESGASASDRGESRRADSAQNGLLVRVVDEQGEPVRGVPLTETLDEVVHVFDLTGERGEVAPLDTGWESVAVALPFDPPVQGEFDEFGFVELVVPPVGEILFEAPEGVEPADQGLWLGFLGKGDSEEHLEVRVGPVDFPLRVAIPLGAEYLFEGYLTEYEPVRSGFQSPLSPAAPRRVHELRLGQARQVISGRLLLPDGEPCLKSAAFIERSGLRLRMIGSPMTEPGAFRCVLLRSPELFDGVRFLGWAGSEFADFEYVFPFPARFAGVDHQLGDITLAPRRLLLAGRIDGAKLERGTKLRVFRRTANEAEWLEIERDFHIDQETRGFRIFQGRFQPGSEYRVHITRAGGIQASCGAFLPGTDDFVIEVEPPATLVSELVVAEPISSRDLSLSFDYDECSPMPPDRKPRSFRRSLQSLSPGDATVTLRHKGGAVLFESRVRLHPDQTTELTIDLAGDMLDLRVTPQWPERPGLRGSPRVRVLYRESESSAYGLEAAELAHALPQGQSAHRILSLARAVDVLVLGTGYQARWFDGVTESFSPTMSPGPTIWINDPRSLNERRSHPGGNIIARIIPEDPRLRSAGPFRVFLGRRFGLPTAGSYRLEWCAQKYPEDPVLLDVETQTIEVSAGHQVLDLDLPLAALDAYRASKASRAR